MQKRGFLQLQITRVLCYLQENKQTLGSLRRGASRALAVYGAVYMVR
jgi:hypothetical protein